MQRGDAPVPQTAQDFEKSLLNCGNPCQTGQAGRVINICNEFLVIRLRLPSAVDVLLWHTAVGVLRQENHLCLLDFDLNRDEFTPPH